jgi:hypothetical protein
MARAYEEFPGLIHDMAGHDLRVGLKLYTCMLDLVMVRWKRRSFSSNGEVTLGLGHGWVECTAAVVSITIEMSWRDGGRREYTTGDSTPVTHFE